MGRLRSKRQAILSAFYDHPDWTNEQIARSARASKSYVDRVLAGKRRPSRAAETPTEPISLRASVSPESLEPDRDTMAGSGILPDALPVPVSDEVAARLDVESAASGLPSPTLAASLIDEGLKTREYPGIVYRDGPAGRRASLAGGPDVWQVIRALKEVPADGFDPVETVSVEADLHPRQIRLAMEFHKAYPDEIQALLEANRRALVLADEMIADRERTIAEQQADRARRTVERDDSPSLDL